MSNKRIISAVPIHTFDIPEMLRNCHTARTWAPRALGVFGTENGGVMVERLESGALMLPNKSIGGKKMPTDVFRTDVRNTHLTHARFAIYDMYDTPPEYDHFSNGRVYFAVSATLSPDSAQQLKQCVEIPAAQLHERLVVNEAAYGHVMTSIALLAVQEYTRMLSTAS